ncbi:MAG: HD domain-containing protein [Candidatus Paceibacterota bacterium]
MTIEETRKRIMEDDEFVLSEMRKIQELFKMKRVIRYHHTRAEVIDTESVAEHVYGMMVLADYFIPLEASEDWDYIKIQQMALYHDIDEIITGDRIGYLKTDADRAKEYDAQNEVLKLLPELSRTLASAALEEYELQKTVESKFAKAIDKIEPLFHLINENGKEICKQTGVTYSQSRSIKDKYVQEFPYIKRFNDVLNQHMLENGYFSSEQ